MARLVPVAVISLLVCAMILSVAAAPAQSRGPLARPGDSAEPGVASGGHYRLITTLHAQPDPVLPYVVEPVAASGGGYRLASPTPSGVQGASWQVSGEASGGRYRLLSTAAPTRQSSGCCCTFLPCVPRNQ